MQVAIIVAIIITYILRNADSFPPSLPILIEHYIGHSVHRQEGQKGKNLYSKKA